MCSAYLFYVPRVAQISSCNPFWINTCLRCDRCSLGLGRFFGTMLLGYGGYFFDRSWIASTVILTIEKENILITLLIYNTEDLNKYIFSKFVWMRGKKHVEPTISKCYLQQRSILLNLLIYLLIKLWPNIFALCKASAKKNALLIATTLSRSLRYIFCFDSKYIVMIVYYTVE